MTAQDDDGEGFSFAGLPATADDNAAITDMLGAFGNLGLGSSESLPFLGLDNAGNWKYGQDQIQPEPDALWGADLKSAKYGYVAWVNSKPAGQVMWPVNQKRDRVADLDDPSLPWQDQVSIEMTCLTGSDAGTRVLFKQSSDGGRKAFLSLIEAARQTLRPGNLKNYVPVVRLEKKSYWHDAFKKDITKPIFGLVGWGPGALLACDEAALAALPKPNGSPPAAPAAAGGKPPKGKPPVEAVAAEATPSPTGRRRRVGA